MKMSSLLVALSLGLGLGFACGQSSTGTVVLGLKDGPPTSSDGRTITSLEVDLTRIDLEAATAEAGDAGHRPDAERGHVHRRSDTQRVTVFDAGTGAPRTVDLLTVTSFSSLVANATVPAGTYDGARVVVSGARAVFSDAPGVKVPLQLDGDGDESKAHFEFDFNPAVTVNANGTTMAVLDFVPVVTKDPAGAYLLGHDAQHHDSGEREHGDDLELHGKVAAVDAAKKTITLDSATAAVDISQATLTLRGRAATIGDVQVGQRAEIEMRFDATTKTLIAKKVELQ